MHKAHSRIAWQPILRSPRNGHRPPKVNLGALPAVRDFLWCFTRSVVKTVNQMPNMPQEGMHLWTVPRPQLGNQSQNPWQQNCLTRIGTLSQLELS